MTDTKLIIFGATGDLVKSKIMPALTVLGIEPLLYGRKDINDPRYIRGELTDISEKLVNRNITHAYVALPPVHYETVLRQLARLDPIPRVALEKPFGSSLADAKHLLDIITELKLTDYVYLVDHYLGKSSLLTISDLDVTAKKILIDDASIAHVEIDAWETIDVGTRGVFYSQVGTIRDFVQNHIMSVIATIFMSGGCKENQSACRTEVLDKLHYEPGSLVVGQYQGFLDVPGVEPDCTTETYISARLNYNKQFPIIIRTGKALSEAKSLVTITRKDGEKQEIDLRSQINPYEIILKNFLSNSPRTSLSFAEALAAWKITEEIVTAKQNTQLVRYIKGSNPYTILR